MALYSYHCPICNQSFDRFLPVKQRGQPQECPNGHPGAARQFTFPAITQPDRGKTFRQKQSKTPHKFFT